MKNFFLKSNIYLYGSNFFNFLFSYLFILLATNYLAKEDYFQFTGFVSLLNLFLIPISCLGISISGLFENKKLNKEKYKTLYSRTLGIFFLSILIVFFINYFTNLNRFFLIDDKYYISILIILVVSLLFSLEIADLLGSQEFIKYSITNSIPFFIRIILLVIILIFLKKENFIYILLIYLLGYSFLINKYVKRFREFFSINLVIKKTELGNLNYIKNLINISVFVLILNFDVISARFIQPEISNEYYIASLFGKIIFFISSITVLFMYPTNIQKTENNFSKVLIFNTALSLLLMVFYYFFLEYFIVYLFPNNILEIKMIMLISIFCFFFSISNILSFKLNIEGLNIHAAYKIIICAIAIPMLFYLDDIDQLISFLVFLSFGFALIDGILYIKYKKN